MLGKVMFHLLEGTYVGTIALEGILEGTYNCIRRYKCIMY
jgi:hypothetical protein